jgi:hypothetical protein
LKKLGRSGCRFNVVGDLLIEARMADENGGHLLLPDRSTSI